MDLNCIATLFNIKIAVFVFSSTGSIIPRWDWILPNMDLISRSPRYHHQQEQKEMWLFNEDSVYFNLLVPRNCLNEVNNTVLTVGVIQEDLQERNTVFSPMDFMKCPRGVGRPKKKRFGAPKFTNKKFTLPEEEPLDKEKKKRGRPLGSKNKLKSQDEPPHKRPKQSTREMAELAASVSLEEESDFCKIFEFNFDHPLKREISITKCQHCEIYFHEPCLRKSGCIYCCA